MMNKAGAIKLAKEQGFTVTKEVKFEGVNAKGIKSSGVEFSVNGKRIAKYDCDGSACWSVDGVRAGYGQVADCILAAIGIKAYRGQIIA